MSNIRQLNQGGPFWDFVQNLEGTDWANHPAAPFVRQWTDWVGNPASQNANNAANTRETTAETTHETDATMAGDDTTLNATDPPEEDVNNLPGFIPFGPPLGPFGWGGPFGFHQGGRGGGRRGRGRGGFGGPHGRHGPPGPGEEHRGPPPHPFGGHHGHGPWVHSPFPGPPPPGPNGAAGSTPPPPHHEAGPDRQRSRSRSRHRRSRSPAGRRERGHSGTPSHSRSRSRSSSPSSSSSSDNDNERRTRHRRHGRREHGHGHGPRHGGPGGRGRGGPGFGHRGRGGRHGAHGHGHGHGGQGGPFNMGNLAQFFQEQIFGGNGVDARGNAEHTGVKETDGDFAPPADVFDTESSYVVDLAIPGVKKSDIAVHWDVASYSLVVSGVVHRAGDEEFLKTLALDERKVGAFKRSVKLGSRAKPALVDAEGITAKLEDGVLRVVVPKEEREFEVVHRVEVA